MWSYLDWEEEEQEGGTWGWDRYLVVSRIPTGTGVLSEPGMFYCSKFI